MSEDERTDAALIAAVNACDEEAFEVLYERHRDWVVALAYRFTGDRELALDVLQEVFLYFVRRFPGFTLTCQLKTFLYPVVRNCSITAAKKARRFRGDGMGGLEQAEAGSLSEPGCADGLELVLSTLTEEHREVLMLRFVDGLSLGEISRATEVPLGTVKSRLHHGLKRLREDERTRTLLFS